MPAILRYMTQKELDSLPEVSPLTLLYYEENDIIRTTDPSGQHWAIGTHQGRKVKRKATLRPFIPSER